MFRHRLAWVGHRRTLPKRQNDVQGLPASIGNPTATLPASIGPTDIATDPSATAQILSAKSFSGLTTVTETQTLAQSISGLGFVSTVTTERTRTITDPAEYASLTSEAARTASPTAERTSSRTVTPTATSAAAQQSSSHLTTLIPAIVVPIAVVLLASLGCFWFFMRRRHRRELASQPEFVMAGKGEKLSSRSNSGRSTLSGTFGQKSPTVIQTELYHTNRTPPAAPSEWSAAPIGVARPLTPQETPAPAAAHTRGRDRSFDRPRPAPWSTGPRAGPQHRNVDRSGPMPGLPARPAPPGPPYASRDRPPYRDRSYSNPGSRGPPPGRSGSSPSPRTGPSPVPRGGPSPNPPRLSPVRPAPGVAPTSALPQPNGIAPSTAFRLRDPSPSMHHNSRAKAPARLEAPGAYNGASSISRYSPIVKEAPGLPLPPTHRTAAPPPPPPPLETSTVTDSRRSLSPASPQDTVLTEENRRIARFANYANTKQPPPLEPSLSPKLPPPATRSQLIPWDSPKDEPDHYFGSATSSVQAQAHDLFATFADPKRISAVSDADDYEDIDAKSDVSSLNEFERFDFGAGIGSRGGSTAGDSLTYFTSQTGPAGGRATPSGDMPTHERW